MTYLAEHPARVAALLAQHLLLVGSALLLALAIALPLGVLAARRPAFERWVTGTAAVLYTVPSLALLALLVAVFGLGAPTAVVALVLYAQLALVRGTIAALHGVDPALVEAARGVGLSAREVLLRVEVPVALPVLLAAVRIALVTLIALATVAAWIDAGGLGVLIFEGIHTGDARKIVAGALVSAVLAVAADLALRATERAVRT